MGAGGDRGGNSAVFMHKEGVLDAAAGLRDRLAAAGIRVKLDGSDNSPGWKFAEYEMKGVPLRVEIGPKDMEKNQCVLARRDTGEKLIVALDELEETAAKLLNEIHDNLYAMNPNDHPHGGGEGRAPVGRPGPVTPWGKPAMGYKTRKGKNPTNKFIVKRRNVK